MIRLKDVAARAGVSMMTVSKVLRNAPDVSQATKARVRGLVEEMGYVPDSQAQSLRMRRTRMFGLILPDITDPWLAHAAAAIEERVQELGYQLLVCQTKDQTQREELCIRNLLSRRIDGLFIHPVYRMAPLAPVYEELLRSGTHTVVIGHLARFCEKFANVETDDVLGSEQLASHLIGLGHKRIAYLAGHAVAPWAQERLEGYRRALRGAGLECDDRLVFTAGAGLSDGEEAARQMMEESAGATAVMAITDHVAMGAASAILKSGLRIPEDISVAGFGNCLAAEHFRVPLTTVQQPKLGFGVIAAEQMVSLLRGGKVESKRLSCELVVRHSTGQRAGRIVIKPGRQDDRARPAPG
jgi:LacI family transcriptional regulator